MDKTDTTIKKPTQYTLKGIRLGKFDDDLDRLLKTVQRRRANIGQLKVIKIGPGGEFLVEEQPDLSASAKTHLTEFTYNHDKLDERLLGLHDKLIELTSKRSEELSQPQIRATGYSYGTVVVNGEKFEKNHLIGRVCTIEDNYASESALGVVYVVSIARRNLTCWPLEVSTLASDRKRRAVQTKARSGQQVTVPPEAIADLYANTIYSDTFDPLRVFHENGKSMIRA